MATTPENGSNPTASSSHVNGEGSRFKRDPKEGMEQLEAFVMNARSLPSELLRAIIDPRRNIELECGYPEGSKVDVNFYQDLYNRDAIAVRIVQVLPRECWQVQPVVYEDEDNATTTKFEEAFTKLSEGLYGEDSFYRDTEESLLWEYLRRGDELSGIGGYGGVFLGLDDNGELREEVKPVPYGQRKLQYMRALPEGLLTVKETVGDPNDRRYGQPLYYDMQLADGTETVHWTRVIHLADNLDSSEWQGTPRMQPVLNRILDLRKLYAGSAEMYWRGAFPGISLETHPNLNPQDIRFDEEKLRVMMENYGEGLQRYLALMGLSAKSLAPQVVDPTPQIRVQIEAICIRLGVPKRIFMGSERGELASVQDDKTWNDRLKERQRNYCTPRIVRPFVDRLIWLGVLPKPPKFYRVRWPDMTFQTEQDRVKVAIVKTEAIIRMAQSLPNPLIIPRDWWIEVMNVSSETADMLVAHVKEHGWDGILPGLKNLVADKGGGLQPVGFGDDPTSGLGQSTFVKASTGFVSSDTDGSIKVPRGGKAAE
jgi:uncharacterized protein